MARTKEFDREEALRRAMKTFWDKGYDATSIPDLMAAMAISRSSLYDTFTDKQALFMEALDCYLHFLGQRHAAIFRDAVSVKEGLRAYLGDVIDLALDTDYPGGCFFINTAIAINTADEQVRAAVTRGIDKVERGLAAFLEQGKLRGEIGEDRDTLALARFVLGLICGLNVVARVRKDRKTLEDMISIALEEIH
jgi:TetR/AcrR family transcriptional repressor of nem operon